MGAIVLAIFAAPALTTLALAPTQTPTQPFTPTLTRTPLPPPTATATETALPTITRTTTPTRPPVPNVTRAATRVIAPHFLVGRPVSTGADMLTPSLSYLYGTTQGGNYDVHHGEEFENRTGTPLFAVADGTVVVAGSDAQPACGDSGKVFCGRDVSGDPKGFYGKLVVIQLNRDYNGQRVFALYGHMSQIAVQKGDAVKAGDAIGAIGSTGIALGPHVHFEIRLGTNDYGSTRNPILWMTPLAGRGAIVGRYLDPSGNPVRSATINVYRANGDFIFATETYGRDQWSQVNSDDDLGETFAIGDFVPGDYILRVVGQQFASRITVEAGKIAWVEMGIPQ